MLASGVSVLEGRHFPPDCSVEGAGGLGYVGESLSRSLRDETEEVVEAVPLESDAEEDKEGVILCVPGTVGAVEISRPNLNSLEASSEIDS